MYNYGCNVIAFKFNVGLVRFQIAVFLYEFVIFFCKKTMRLNCCMNLILKRAYYHNCVFQYILSLEICIQVY